MRRREFISLFGGATAWPLGARAQQPALPTIGFLAAQTAEANADNLLRFRQGLKEEGFVENENVKVEYRFAENQIDRLQTLASELVRRRVEVIAVSGGPASASAANATTSIPVIFMVPEDPVRGGLVMSLARPGGNATGINFFSAELGEKRLQILRELVPTATRV